jgi:hypothetical protein
MADGTTPPGAGAPGAAAGATAPGAAAPGAAPTGTPPAGGTPATPDWTTGLDADVVNNPVVKGRTPAAIAKDLVNLQALIGRKGVVVPKEGDPDSVRAEYRRAIGVPEKADGYEIKPPEGIAEGLWNQDAAAQWGELAHKLDLTPAQERAIRQFQLDRVAGAVQEREGAGKANGAKVETSLKQQWGEAMPAKMQAADRAIAHFKLPDGFLDQIRQSGPDHAISTLQALAELGEAIGADSGLIGGRSGSRSTMTPGEAQAEIARITGDMNGPYWQERHPEHQIMLDRVLALRQMAGAAKQ